MSRKALVLPVVVVVISVMGGAVAASADARWRRPLPGGVVVGSFSFDGSAPYERGRRRGIDVRGRPGERVVAACGGVVTYGGRVPGWGRGVTVRCAFGRLVATELGLASVTVSRGARVPPGAVVGRLAARGLLRLGARVATRRHGYVDPAALLGDDEGDPRWPTITPAPRRRLAPPPAARPAPARRPTPTPATHPSTPALRWPAWAGLALLAGALATTTTVHRRRRRRPASGIAVAQR